jgi:hypothetical protein
MKYVTFTNSGSIELCHNMILSLRRFTDEDIIIYCLDESSVQYLKEKQFNNVTINTKFSFKEKYWEYGTQEFKNIMFIKLKCLLDILNTYTDNIFFIDADVFFANSPCERLKQEEQNEYSLICQTDRPTGSRWCAGVMMMKNNQEIKSLLNEAIHISEQLKNIKNDSGEWHDQTILNHILARGNNKVKCFETTFATNGHLYFSNNGPKERLNQSIIHANFCVGTQQKIDWFKSESMWLI